MGRKSVSWYWMERQPRRRKRGSTWWSWVQMWGRYKRGMGRSWRLPSLEKGKVVEKKMSVAQMTCVDSWTTWLAARCLLEQGLAFASCVGQEGDLRKDLMSGYQRGAWQAFLLRYLGIVCSTFFNQVKTYTMPDLIDRAGELKETDFTAILVMYFSASKHELTLLQRPHPSQITLFRSSSSSRWPCLRCMSQCWVLFWSVSSPKAAAELIQEPWRITVALMRSFSGHLTWWRTFFLKAPSSRRPWVVSMKILSQKHRETLAQSLTSATLDQLPNSKQRAAFYVRTVGCTQH